MDRNLALEVVRVTEAAALSSARWMGRGNPQAPEQAAADAMRRAFDAVDFAGTVVLGEGERGQCPMLYVGERLGSGREPEMEVALDPLDGASSVAHGRDNALAVVALADRNAFLRVADTAMDKIAVGPRAAGAINITRGPEENLHAIAEAMRCHVEDLTVAILDRPRHEDIVRRIREVGARIKLIADGDLSAAIATGVESSGVDVLMGTGGSREGVLAAAALQCLGGDLQGRLRPRNDTEAERVHAAGVRDLDHVFAIGELAAGKNVLFAATGVTDGDLLQGVRFFGGGARTHSMVVRSRSGTIRFIEATHRFDRQPVY
ncbi:MAG TPA: class II fructose-bisphosphatase [Candidatus Methylomirabilis sp.]